MKTDLKDFVASFFLILISLSGAVSLLLALQDWLVATSGPYAALVLLVVFALAYGCLTALALAAVSFVWPLRVGDYGSTHPQFTLWKVQHVVGELGKLAGAEHRLVAHAIGFEPTETRRYKRAIERRS